MTSQRGDHVAAAPGDDLISRLRRVPTPHGPRAAEAAARFAEGMQTLARGMGVASTQFAGLARSVDERAATPPGPHAFTPDVDLACTHPRCTYTAEEH